MGKQKAFGYTRVSSQGQVEGNGFDRQAETITGYAKGHGFDIVKVFREQAISGTKDVEDRPAFKEMVSEILANSVRVIIVERLDRLARDLTVQTSILAYLKRKEIVLIDAGTGENVIEAMDSDPMRRAMVQVQGVFSELDKSQLVLKLRKAREKIRGEGKRCEGRRGYGQDSEEERLLITRVKLMRRPRKNGGRRMTLAEIADALNDKTIQPRKAQEWSVSLIANLLKKKGQRGARVKT